MTSILKVDTIQTAAGGTPTAADLGLSVTGSVLQVVSSIKTDTAISSSQSFVDVTGLSANITPSSTTSKILVLVDYKGDSWSHGGGRVLRNGTLIGAGDAAGNRLRASFHFANAGSDIDNQRHRIHSQTVCILDEPSTTGLLTYKVQIGVPWSASYQITCNRSINDPDTGYSGRTSSSITLIEIAG